MDMQLRWWQAHPGRPVPRAEPRGAWDSTLFVCPRACSVQSGTSRGQKCVSLSSCESEWYAAVSASCDLVYFKQCLDTLLDGTLTLKVRLDNSAAKARACRESPSGKTRHVDARLFWVQEKVKTGEIHFASVPGLLNPADISTKF